ncbi:DUF3768 domain-containing protein [Azospirillum rugosum]|uniref:DUF3768 domain-containing protein n=1 Tax=Azospirillum rugosum TaxID=416170 RepID=A0ABS4SRG2_9PROT|nr:DUF3768 domain-containing protein [Azospirillum rugosum]MBP2295156.1 hypothetical protein [Azospirillum rugosum]MDQ0528530.1 hypothetical protein [Azospirillum rugosum]
MRDAERRAAIARLNDRLRQTFVSGQVIMSRGVAALPDYKREAIVQAVREFNRFDANNDPYGEHDCAAFTVVGLTLLWKIDTYQDGTLTFGADDPLSPTAVRVLTIMLSEDY